MSLKEVKHIHKAEFEPISDLITYRAIPASNFPMNALDPFIFLNHHGYQEYQPDNNGLPFGPHPHRGFETVTFILDGDLMHKDSSGAESVIKAGGIQWMTAGKGLIHAEISSDEFKKNGGPLEILQLWINLPASLKMTEPKYTGLQKEQIPEIRMDGDKVIIHVISGKWDGVIPPFETLTNIHLSYIDLKKDAKAEFVIPRDVNVLCYTVKGEVTVNGTSVPMHHTAEFEGDGSEINIEAAAESLIIFGYAPPLKEPFAAYGPFVMNTIDEIKEAYRDYENGEFGSSNL